MVPDFYVYNVKADTIAAAIGLSHKVVNGDTIPVKHKLQFTLTYNNNVASGREASVKSEVIDWDGQKVDTLTIRFPKLDGSNKGSYFNDVEFPYSYKNLRFCWPVLEVTSTASKTEVDRSGYTHNFCIDRIILRSKED